MKIVYLFLLFSFSYGLVTPSLIENWNEKISLNRLDEVLLEAEPLKQDNFEDIELRTILFKAYLYKGLKEKAEEEISFIEKRMANDKTLYLRALQAYQNKDSDTALKFIEAIQAKRYSPPYLLAFEIYLQKKFYSKAQEVLNIYESLEGQNNEWFFNKGKLLLTQGLDSVETLREHIVEYSKSYPVDHRQMYLRANYYAIKGQYDLALNFIEKAIYLSFSDQEYINQKSYFLFRDHRWRELIEFIEKTEWSSREDEIRYLFLNNFIKLINYKSDQAFFELKNPENLATLIQPLEKILYLNVENERARFLLEEILLANTQPNDERRKPYANFHLEKGLNFFNKGQYQNSLIEYNRMLQLYPYDKNFYEHYLEYLRTTKRYEDYSQEMKNYENIFKEVSLEKTMKKQLAEKQIQESLAKQFGITPLITQPITEVLLIYQQRSLKDNWDNPYQEILINQHLFNILKQSPLVNVDNVEKKNQLQKTLDKKYDYSIEFSSEEVDGILKISLQIISPQRIPIYNEQFSFFGKEKYFQMINKITSVFLNIFPKIGKVAAIDNRKVVFSLGSLHGIKKDDLVTLTKNGKVLGEFKVEEVNNYYSLITIDKIFILSQVEIGDQILLPSTTESK